MSIQEIEKRIIEEAQSEASHIKKEAEREIEKLEKFHIQEKEEIRTNILQEAKRRAEEIKRSYLIPARMTARKAMLEEKQKILEGIYSEIQKEKKLPAAEIAKVREDTEVKIAKILYG